MCWAAAYTNKPFAQISTQILGYRYNDVADVIANFIAVLVHSDCGVLWLDYWLIVQVSQHLT